MRKLQNLPTSNPKCTFYKYTDSGSTFLKQVIIFLQTRPFIFVSVLTLALVWSGWLVLLRPDYAIANIMEHWAIAVTMFFGSMVAGGTSMGGGAVAFPVLTKVLEIPAQDAKIFSLAIQTIGMGAASITIVAMGTRLQWPVIRLASLGGIPGVFLGTAVFAPILPANAIRLSFTMMVSSFAIILLVLNRSNKPRKLGVSRWHRREKIVTFCAGFLGGILSGLVGSGMDICVFSTMVVLFNLCEKNSTPTSVVLMAINAAVGFLIHQFVLGDFVAPVQQYWFAAIPVVVVGAPAGAIICSLLNRQTIVNTLVILIGLELTSSLLLIPLSISLISLAVAAFISFCGLYYWMYQTRLT
ncbi:MAG: sulfite exporter TauE/SafE family protein [Cyanothece sp. SIO2G6]|nr:sulfite exporter TauE/SafE family protein [Cyanothece sp. SIO2G6]